MRFILNRKSEFIIY